MTDTMIAPAELTATGTEAVAGAALPGFVFQQSEIITFQAFKNQDSVLVQVTQIGTSYPGTTNVNLSPSSPTANLDIKVWVGSGAVQLNEGTISLTLDMDGGSPSGVTASLLLIMYNSSNGQRVCSVGGVYQLTF